MQHIDQTAKMMADPNHSGHHPISVTGTEPTLPSWPVGIIVLAMPRRERTKIAAHAFALEGTNRGFSHIHPRGIRIFEHEMWRARGKTLIEKMLMAAGPEDLAAIEGPVDRLPASFPPERGYYDRHFCVTIYVDVAKIEVYPDKCSTFHASILPQYQVDIPLVRAGGIVTVAIENDELVALMDRYFTVSAAFSTMRRGWAAARLQEQGILPTREWPPPLPGASGR